MLPRSAETDAFWQGFRRHAGLDHDNYVIGSFGDTPEMATELADLVIAGNQEGDGELGTGLERRLRADTKARRLRSHARRRRSFTVHLANHRGND
jgi:hypothetical protein